MDKGAEREGDGQGYRAVGGGHVQSESAAVVNALEQGALRCITMRFERRRLQSDGGHRAGRGTFSF